MKQCRHIMLKTAGHMQAVFQEARCTLFQDNAIAVGVAASCLKRTHFRTHTKSGKQSILIAHAHLHAGTVTGRTVSGT
jgi:hypothetical protein